MSDVIPVAVQHPILLDVASKEAMEDTGEPMSPLSFRGFRLHIVWTQQSGGGLAYNIPFPHYLKPPSTDHWNITSDLVLPLALDECR